MNDSLSVQDAGPARATERDEDLPAMRDADCAPVAVAEPSPVEPWVVTWKRGLAIQRDLRDRELRARCDRERRYCEQIRDAKANGTRPLTAEEFFAKRETILEL